VTSERELSLWRPIALLTLVIGLLIVAKAVGLEDSVYRLREWIEQLGTAGIFVFLGAYIIGVVAIIPGSALTLLAGPLFGPVLGIVLVSIGATIGASVSFLIARYFAREPVSQLLRKNERFHRLDHLTEIHGDVMVAITRLVPLFPFSLLNYAFGLTRVPFWTYMFWSWVCMLPSTAFYVLSAGVVSEAWVEGKITWALAGLLVFTSILLLVLRKYVRYKFQEDLTYEPLHQTPSPARKTADRH
jgi:uncharacterized membrane protein YdjX (TVP38/TMEM64 family)